MPTYEYICQKCGHQFEQFQSMLDRPLVTCPRALCGMKRWGKGRVKRAIGAGAGVIFKGSGFYITDYRSDSYRQAASKESGSPGSTTGKDGKSASGTGGEAGGSSPAKAASKTAAKPASPAS
jgi:putative FmdB family regulatory protein